MTLPDPQLLLSALPEALILVKGRRVECVNHRLCELTGRAVEEIQDQPLDACLQAEDAARVVEQLHLLGLGGTPPRPLLVRLRAGDGRLVPAEARLARAGDHGLVAFRELESEAEVGRLLAGLADACGQLDPFEKPARLLDRAEPILEALGWRGVLWRIEGEVATPVRLLAPGPEEDPAWGYGRRILGSSFPLGDLPRVAEVVREGRTLAREDVPEVISAFHARRGGHQADVEDHKAALVEQALQRGVWIPFSRRGEVDEVLILTGPDASDLDLAAMRMFAQAYDAARQLYALGRRLSHHRRVTSAGEVATALAQEVQDPLSRSLSRLDEVEQGLGAGRPVREVLEALRQDLDRLLLLTHDFLLFVRPPRPKQENVDLTQVVHQALRNLRRRPALAGVVPRVGLELETLPPVWGDAELLRLALENLLLDAWHRGAVVRLSAAPARDGGVVMRAVETGGPLREGQEALFDPFRSHDGVAALGRAVVREAVEAMGGRVSVEATEDGAVYTVWLAAGQERRAEL